MAGNSAFELVQEQGWRRGLSNMLDLEFGKWWLKRGMWMGSLIWVVIVGFFLLATTVLNPEPVSLTEAVMLYCVFGGIFPSIAVIISMQDTLVGEKQSGTAAWMLSKPLSRPAFILSKLFSGMARVLVTMVLLPGIVAYVLLSYGNNSPLDPLGFLGGLAVLWLDQLFFLGLTLMLGSFFSSRAPVVGIPLALLFLQQYLIGFVPLFGYLLPWTLIIPMNGSNPSALVPSLMTNQPVTSWLPVLLIALEVVLFMGVAIWRFNKEEF